MGRAPDLDAGLMAAFRRLYGRGPGHLAAMLVCLAMTAYAVGSLFQNARPWSVLLWLGAAVLVHDLVLLPLYTGAFWLASRAGRARGDRGRTAILHHVAAPAALSALLFLVWLPLILRLSEASYRPTTGMTQEPYLSRWLLLTAALFVGSALLWGARELGRRRR
jgi:hypothetical protein